MPNYLIREAILKKLESGNAFKKDQLAQDLENFEYSEKTQKKRGRSEYLGLAGNEREEFIIGIIVEHYNKKNPKKRDDEKQITESKITFEFPGWVNDKEVIARSIIRLLNGENAGLLIKDYISDLKTKTGDYYKSNFDEVVRFVFSYYGGDFKIEEFEKMSLQKKIENLEKFITCSQDNDYSFDSVFSKNLSAIYQYQLPIAMAKIGLSNKNDEEKKSLVKEVIEDVLTVDEKKASVKSIYDMVGLLKNNGWPFFLTALLSDPEKIKGSGLFHYSGNEIFDLNTVKIDKDFVGKFVVGNKGISTVLTHAATYCEEKEPGLKK